jgi:hypothetical protein
MGLVTAKAPATQMSIQRAIKAAQKQGLHVLAIRPDGTVVVGKQPIETTDVIPTAPQTTDDAEREFWEKVK